MVSTVKKWLFRSRISSRRKCCLLNSWWSLVWLLLSEKSVGYPESTAACEAEAKTDHYHAQKWNKLRHWENVCFHVVRHFKFFENIRFGISITKKQCFDPILGVSIKKYLKPTWMISWRVRADQYWEFCSNFSLSFL